MKHLLALILALFAFSAEAQVVPNQAVLAWTAPATRVDGTAITGVVSYNVYQGVGTGSTKAKIGTVTTAGSTINSGLLSNTTYCWEVTALEGSGPESARSLEVCKSFAASPPNRVTVTVQ